MLLPKNHKSNKVQMHNFISMGVAPVWKDVNECDVDPNLNCAVIN